LRNINIKETVKFAWLEENELRCKIKIIFFREQILIIVLNIDKAFSFSFVNKKSYFFVTAIHFFIDEPFVFVHEV